MRLLTATLPAVLAVLMAACAGSAEPTLTPRATDPINYVVTNVDGPPVDVRVNRTVVGHLTCGMDGLDLTALTTAPDLPWTVELVRRDGTVLGTAHVAAVVERLRFTIRGQTAVEQPPNESTGGIPRTPCPT